MHVVTCMDGCWLYKNELYPTLYTVTMKITGEVEYARTERPEKTRKISNWSATRFFNL